MSFLVLRERIYDAKLGRFISPDPTIPHVHDTRSYNRYSYARNNPLKYIDPSGYSDFNLFDSIEDWDNENPWSHEDNSFDSFSEKISIEDEMDEFLSPSLERENERITLSIYLIRKTNFGNTKRGKQIISKLVDLHKNENISFEKLKNVRAIYNTGFLGLGESIKINSNVKNSDLPGRLVHEGTHAVRFSEHFGKDSLFNNEREAFNNAYKIDLEINPLNAYNPSDRELKRLYNIK